MQCIPEIPFVIFVNSLIIMSNGICYIHFQRCHFFGSPFFPKFKRHLQLPIDGYRVIYKYDTKQAIHAIMH